LLFGIKAQQAWLEAAGIDKIPNCPIVAPYIAIRTVFGGNNLADELFNTLFN
jgi:hypothetical protein